MLKPALPLLATLTLLTACTHQQNPPTAIAPPPAPKATVVIVHGAWGGGWAFRDVDRRLTADGYKVFRPTLTGQGERVHLASPSVGLDTHIADVVNTLRYEDLHNVILVGHSYGGMVVTGVADQVPDRIAKLIYVDALLPNDGESLTTAIQHGGNSPVTHPGMEKDGFLLPTWLKPNTPPPHDVPQSLKTFNDPLHLTHPDALAKIPTLYILTVDKGHPPEKDTFYPFYQRAKERGIPTEIMEGDHNVQWSHPAELVRLLEKAVP